MTAEGLATQGAKASAAMMLTKDLEYSGFQHQKG